MQTQGLEKEDLSKGYWNAQKITFFTENNHRLSGKNADVSIVSKKNEQIIFHGFP